MLDLSGFHSPVSICSFWWLLGTWGGKRYVTQLQDGGRVVGSLDPCRLPGTFVSSNLTYLHLYFSPTWQSRLRHTCGLFSLIVVRYWGCSLPKMDSLWLLVMIQTPLGLWHILHQLPNRGGLSYCFYLHPRQRPLGGSRVLYPATFLWGKEGLSELPPPPEELSPASLSLSTSVSHHFSLWRGCKVASSKRSW